MAGGKVNWLCIPFFWHWEHPLLYPIPSRLAPVHLLCDFNQPPALSVPSVVMTTKGPHTELSRKPNLAAGTIVRFH